MAKRLIGYATTDSNGVATINYIGQGLGELNISAETGGEVLFHYIGTGGTETDQFGYNTTDIQVTSNSTGTTISNTGSVGRTYWANKSGTSTTGTNVDADWNAPLTVEFDVVSYTGNATGIAFQLVVSTPTTIAVSKNFKELGITSNNHFKLVYDGTEVKWYVDDVLKYTQSYSQSNFSIRFYVVNGNSFKYKNFFIYKGTSTLVSNTIPLLDCTTYDKGTNTEYSTKWITTTNLLTVSRDDTGTLLTNTHTTSNARRNIVDTASQSDIYCWNGALAFEFDVVSFTGTITIDFYTNGHNAQRLFSALNIANGNHIKCVSDGTNVKYYVNDTLKSTINVTPTENSRIGLIVNVGDTLKYKNFKVYPI